MTEEEFNFDTDLTALQKLSVKVSLIVYGKSYIIKDENNNWQVINPLLVHLSMSKGSDGNKTKELILSDKIKFENGSELKIEKGYSFDKLIIDEMAKLSDDVLEKCEKIMSDKGMMHVFSTPANPESLFRFGVISKEEYRTINPPKPLCQNVKMSQIPCEICWECPYFLDRKCIYEPNSGCATQ
jgi:hypothetical protein